MDKYIQKITEALDKVESPYFKLETTYEPAGIVRERVFCYELYHQLRLALKDDSGLTLNGEIDKRGHVDFAMEHRKNPDFVFHVPGQHEGNTIVMEVKGRIDKPADIVKDFKTITTFIDKYQYQLGIFLLYNHSFAEFSDALSNLKDVGLLPAIEKTLIITKQAQNIPAKIITPNQKVTLR